MSSRLSLRVLAVFVLFTLIIPLALIANEVYGDGDDDPYSIPEKAEQKYPNLGSSLNQMVARVETRESSAEEAAKEAPVHQGSAVAVTIHLFGNVDDVVAFLEENGGDPRNVGGDYIEAYVPVPLLGPVSQQPGVLRVREIIPPQPEYGPITSQGVQAHRSAAWNQAGYSGQGVKVGVIDVGFEGFGSLMGTELPATVVGRCYTDVAQYSSNLAACESDSSHGTAVAEAIVDAAPEVALYIANPISLADLQSAADWMVSQGVSVINRSASYSWFDGPGDGTSWYRLSELTTINRAVSGRAVWVNSAGNYATKTWFKDSPVIHSVTSSTSNNDYVAFDGFDDVSNGMRGPSGDVRVILRWDDRWGGASSDLGLFLWDPIRSEFVARSDESQTGQAADIPLEIVNHELVEARLYEIVVVHRSGRVPDWVQVMVRGADNIEHYTENGSINNPSESANPGMLAVGAAHYYDTDTIASYSSRGPTPDGRIKPDIVGTACAESASHEVYTRSDGGQCWFSGTSQAAPHVAGMAALVRERFPGYTPQQVAAYLKDNAAQRETPDPNNTWGHGFAYLPPIGGCSNNPGLTADCAALLAARDTLAGTATLNWSANAPITTWDGVTLGGSPLRVIKLQLPNKGLTGEIPTELGSLANLQELWLGGNQLTGEVPTELGSLANLQSLSLWGNQLTGEILTELGSLANLQELWLGGNQLTGEILTELGSLANLQVLSLSQNQLTGPIPTELGGLANLQRLSLWGNQLTGEIPTELGNLANLEQLGLSQNQLIGPIPTELGGLANLQRLSLWGNRLTGEIPTELGNLANLQELYLSDNQLTGEIPTELGGLANLQRLSLWGNRLTGEIPTELGNLANLEQLGLSQNQLTGPIPTELGNLANLQELYLSDNQLTGEIPTELGNLANLQELYLSDNQLTGEIPTELGNLANLEQLRLHYNELSGVVPQTLAGLTMLEHFSFYNNLGLCAPIDDAFQTWLRGISILYGSSCAQADSPEDRAVLVEVHSTTDGVNWTNNANWLSGDLTRQWYGVTNDANGRVNGLFLGDNQLTGEIPPELGNLVNLEELYLWGNELTGTIPAELGNLVNLQELDLADNQLTGEIPAELGRLTNLMLLRLSGNQLTGCVPASWQDVPDNDIAQLGLLFCTPGGSLLAQYDVDNSGRIESSEVLTAIGDFVFQRTNITRDDVLSIIGAFVFGRPVDGT